MIARRDLIIAGACVAAAGTGQALRPRNEVALLQGAKLADVVPKAFGGWTSEDTGDPLAINGPGTLSAKLYNELLTRLYTNTAQNTSVMALMAYGGKQTDDLQLHRPEVCYPAFGYALVRNEPFPLALGSGVTVPARGLAAQAEDRRESIVYWSRIGEELPQSGGEQRRARLSISMQGIIPDGLLSRFSMAGDNPEQDWQAIQGFVRDLVAAIRPASRKVLVGSVRGDLLSKVG